MASVNHREQERNFESKEALLAELLLQVPAELLLQVPADLAAQVQAASEGYEEAQPEQRLQAMAATYLSFALNAPDYFPWLHAFGRGAFPRGISAEHDAQIAAARAAGGVGGPGDP